MQRIPTDLDQVKQTLLDAALSAGACKAAVARPDGAAVDASRLERWLERHPDLSYMTRTAWTRQDARRSVPACVSILSVAFPIPLGDPPIPQDKGIWALVAGYARGPDYHIWIRKRLDEAMKQACRNLDVTIHYRIAVDSFPLMERSLAVSCGLGAIGRNHNLIVPGCGSAVVLAEVLLDVPLRPDPPVPWDPCGTCRRCLDACPTGALRDDGDFDIASCLAYATTEQKDKIPTTTAQQAGLRLFGCDTCQLVCTHNAAQIRLTTRNATKNKAAVERHDEPAHDASMSEWPSAWVDITSWAALSTKGLARRLRGTALAHQGPIRLLRNAAVAAAAQMKQSGAKSLLDALARHVNPLVRAQAISALHPDSTGHDHDDQ
ncbi:MAG: DUF1730 domain-containing protein [Deltaproteobacteria bacterium]|nr:DUF1730 domain-containing protein [Deltaproteobacteria bacterium]